MTSHVCSQNDADEALAESLEVVEAKVLQKVKLGLVKYFERLGSVVIFLHRLVTEADGSIRDYVDVINIGEAIVSEVVADGRHAYRKHIHLAEVGKTNYAAVLQELIAHLEDIEGVHVVMILDIPPVSFVDLADEARQLGLVHLR